MYNYYFIGNFDFIRPAVLTLWKRSCVSFFSAGVKVSVFTNDPAVACCSTVGCDDCVLSDVTTGRSFAKT